MSLNRKTIWLFLFILTEISCSATKESASGVYIFIDKHNPEISEAVHLYPNGTYNFHFQSMMFPEPRLHGNWEVHGHQVFLLQSNKVLDTIFSKDTIQIRTLKYKLTFGNLKRTTRNNHHITLKKIRKHYKKFILNSEPF